MPNLSRLEAHDRFSHASRGREQYLPRCCRIFWIAFFVTAFLLLFAVSIYMLSTRQHTNYAAGFLFCAVICLALSMFLISMDAPSPRPNRISPQPSEGSIDEYFLTLMMRSHSDTVFLTQLPVHGDSTISLPAMVFVSAKLHGKGVESSRASTESTVTAEERREMLDEEAASSSKEEADVTPLDAEELGKATETIVKIVDETLTERGSAEEAGEGSSGHSAEARKVVLQGVRQRRQSPMESQKYVPESEGEKKD